jgi:energy-converting hydrogenase Eha subunit A
MSHETLNWIYTAGTLVSALSVVTIAQIAVVNWMFGFICKELDIPKIYKGFAKFKKWAYAILFLTTVISVGATVAILSYWKVHGVI